MAYMIYRATPTPVGLQRWQLLGLSLLTAMAPDLDFIPGFLQGDPNRYHHGISHSIGLATLWAAACSIWLLLAKRAPVGRTFALFFSLYTSHLVLDWLSIDTTAPYGVPFFWPLNDAYYIAPFAFWPDIRRAMSSRAFLPSLLSWHNLWAVTVECLVLLTAIVFMQVLKNLITRRSEEAARGESLLKPKRGEEGPA